MNEDQTWLHFMKMTTCISCTVWHSGYTEWKQDIEELAQFYMQCLEQVIVFLISCACQSDDWEGICCCIRDIIKYLFAHNLPQPPTPSVTNLGGSRSGPHEE